MLIKAVLLLGCRLFTYWGSGANKPNGANRAIMGLMSLMGLMRLIGLMVG